MKGIRKFVCMVVSLALIITTLPVVKAQAAQAIEMGENQFTIQSVANLDSVVTGSKYTNLGSWLNFGMEVAIPLNLKTYGNGTIRFLFSFDKDFTSSYMNVYMCKEADLNSSQRLTDVVEVSNKNTNFTVCLDGGQKYYLVMDWVQKDKVELNYDSQVTVSIIYEQAITNEVSNNSSMSNATPLTAGKTVNGFITVESPIDYYCFTTSGNDKITLAYTFDGARNTSGTGYVKLKNSDGVIITNSDVKYTAANKASEIKIDLGTLPAGAYWIELTGLYGATTLKYTQVDYTVELSTNTKEWTSSITVNVDTEIDYSEILFVKGDIAETDKEKTSIWKIAVGAATKVENDKFEVNENGTYTVRISGKDKTYTLGKITIKNVDSKAPEMGGAVNGGAYRNARCLTFSDGDSGVKSKKVNSFSVMSGVRVSDEGTYSVKLTDKAGNVASYKFCIDYTKPSVSGVANGKTYTGSVTIKYSDSVSGLSSVILDDREIDFIKNKSTTISSDGSHTIIVKDNAGNSTSITFTLK